MDDPVFCEAFVRGVRGAPTLQLGPVAVTRAGAIAALQHAPADVLLVDLGLPDGSGIDVIRAVRSAWPGCQVMVISAFADEAHILAAVEAGARGYLLKDSSPQDMVKEIHALHDGGSPISPLIARRLMDRFSGAPPAQAPGEADVRLSPREVQVLELVAKGFTYDEIAKLIVVAAHTVRTFVRRTYAKLEVTSKLEAVNAARRRGMLPP